MRSLRVLLVVAAVACNGQIAGTDAPGAASSQAKKGEVDKDKDTDKDDKAPTPPSGAASAPSCTFAYASSSSGGDGMSYSCKSNDHYTCSGADAEQDLTCSCFATDSGWTPGSCRCNNLTNPFDFAFDCAGGCAPGPKEYAQCNLPVPADSGSAYSSSGSSGSSSGSSSSSSGG